MSKPGLRGFVCPPGTPTVGTRNEIDWCVGKVVDGVWQGCPHPCVSPPLLAKMYDLEQMNHHKGAYISASMLTGGSCPRQTWFERRHGFYEHPLKRLYSFRGTIIHALIEDGPSFLTDAGWLQEIRMSVELEYDEPMPVLDEEGNWTGAFYKRKKLKITLGGTTDAYNPPQLKLDDFKSMADSKAQRYALKGEVEDKHEIQLNIYRWLIANTRINNELRVRLATVGYDPGDQEFLPAPEHLGIQGISMMQLPYSGTTGEMKVPRAKGFGSEIKDYSIATVRTWPLDEIEGYIRPRAYQWYRWLVLGEKPPVVAKDDAWLCRGCAFNGDLCFPEEERKSAA